jgi:hypothetical protein
MRRGGGGRPEARGGRRVGGWRWKKEPVARSRDRLGVRVVLKSSSWILFTCVCPPPWLQ